MENEIKKIEAFDVDDVSTKLIIIEDDVLRRLRRLRIISETTNRVSASAVEALRLAYWTTDYQSPYEGLDNVMNMATRMMSKFPMISEELISISSDIEKIKTIISKINEYCG